MQEFTEATGPTTARSTLDHLIGNATRAPRATAIRRQHFNRWLRVTFEQFHDEVRQLAKGLAAAGIQPGDRVGIMSGTRYEWTLADYAIWYAGAIGVPIYETSSAEQVEWILSDSGAVGVFLESDRHRAIFDEVASHLPHVRVWVFEDNAVDHLQESGVVVGDDDLDARRDTLTADTIATISYTRGTTGRPNGCMLTHGNLVSAVESIGRALPAVFTPSASALLAAPLAHSFGRTAQLACIYAGVQFGHSSGPEHLLASMATFEPTLLLTLPHIVEAIFRSSVLQARASGHGGVLGLAARTAVEYGRRIDTGGASLPLRLRHAVLDRLVFNRVRAATGGRLTYVVTCGAALGEQLGNCLRGIGVTVLEGYGLTETCAAVVVNRPSAQRAGTVGKPLPGTSIRIEADGQILVRGPQVFAGYWNNRAATSAAMTQDGWLRTGDLATWDADGFLRITGRKQDVIVTSTGRNITPALLEDRVRAHALVSHCMLVGEGKPNVGALVTLDPQTLAAWLADHGRPTATCAEMASDEMVRTAIADAVREANRSVSKAESIYTFAIVEPGWTVEGGQLTPTQQLRRDVVRRECDSLIELLYTTPSPLAGAGQPPAAASARSEDRSPAPDGPAR